MTEQPVLAITGSSRGIGLGIAKYFVAHGYRVAGCSRGEATLQDGNYLHSRIDVADEKQVRRWIRTIQNAYGKLDVLVCNAAVVPAPALMMATSGDTLESVIRTNLIGAYLVCRESAKAMMLKHYGRIITVSSMATGLHDEGTSTYAASKAAVVEMTKVLAKELAPFAITCNVIAPSVVMTSALANLGEGVVGGVLGRLAIKRPLSIEELCKVVEFFVAPESGCITGQVLHMGLVV